MEKVKIIDLKKTILEDNDADADLLRRELKEEKTFYLNVMSSPGSGKTSSILKLITHLRDRYKIGVLEADIDGDVDAWTILQAGIPSVQLHTGGMCHLDAQMSRQGLRQISSPELDLVILENVGNLVCTAEQDTGASVNVEILSLPEGDDKPLKYPLMFKVCQAVIVNKTDTRKFFRFDDEAFKKRVSNLNPGAEIFFLSAKTGEGFEDWIRWLKAQAQEWNS